MGVGRDYELSIYNDLNDHFQQEDTIDGICYRCDFSGNAATSTTDLAAVTPYVHVHVEVKKRSADEGKRASGVFTGADGETGLEELHRFVEGTPWFATPYVLVKFPYAEPVLLSARELHERLDEDGEAKEHLDATVTPSDNVSMRHEPWLGSARSRPDAKEKIIAKLQ